MVVLVAAILSVASHHEGHEQSVAAGGPSAADTTDNADVADVPAPAHLVAHLLGGSGSPGHITVIDTTSGSTVRDLGPVYDPYPLNGFHASADGSSLFYVRLNEPAQRIEIVRVPTVGGATQVVAEGTGAIPSPDGKYLIVETGADHQALELLDLGTHTTRPLPGFPGPTPQTLSTFAWTSDSSVIIASTTDLRPIRWRCPPSGCNPPTTDAPSSWSLWSIRTADPNVQWQRIIGPATSGVSWDLELLGPGRFPRTIAALRRPMNAEETVLTVGLDGTVVDQVPLPEHTTALAVNRSGANVLLEGEPTLQRFSLTTRKTNVIAGINMTEASW